MDKGVFVSFKSVEELFGLEDGSFVSCELALAPQSEREKHENPFECNVVVSSVRRLIKLPEYTANDIIKGDENIFLDEAVYKQHLQNVQSRIDSEVTALNAEFEREESSLKAQISSYKDQLQHVQDDLNQKITFSLRQLRKPKSWKLNTLNGNTKSHCKEGRRNNV